MYPWYVHCAADALVSNAKSEMENLEATGPQFQARPADRDFPIGT